MKAALSIGLVAFVALTACGDDGNDVGLRTRQAQERAAEFRAEQAAAPPTTAAPEPADEAVATDETAPEATAAPTPTPPPVEPTGVVIPVLAIDNTFRPEVVVVNVGDEVLWENRGMNEHDVLRVEGDGWGIETDGFQPGDVYAHIFTEPGEFHYYCSVHGNETVGMIGTVIVNA